MHQYSQRPIVHSPIVPLVQNRFGRNVLWGTAKRPRLAAVTEPFSESEIHEFDVATHVQQQILRFQISVDQPTVVEIVEGLDHATRYESGSVVVKTTSVTQDSPNLASQTRLQHHVNVFCILERSIQPKNFKNFNTTRCGCFVFYLQMKGFLQPIMIVFSLRM